MYFVNSLNHKALQAAAVLHARWWSWPEVLTGGNGVRWERMIFADFK